MNPWLLVRGSQPGTGLFLDMAIHDLDLAQQTLLIRETKFYKSRYVPFGPNLKGRLEEFLNVRRQHLSPMRADDPLFVTLWRAPINDNTIREPFTQILRSLGIDGGRERRMPRHDGRELLLHERAIRVRERRRSGGREQPRALVQRLELHRVGQIADFSGLWGAGVT